MEKIPENQIIAPAESLPQTPPNAPETRQEQRDELYEKVEHKVQLILSAREFAQANAGLNSREIYEKMRPQIDGIRDWLGPKVTDRLRLRNDLEQESHGLQSDLIYGRKPSVKKIYQTNHRIDVINEQLSDLTTDNDLNFLQQIQLYYIGLGDKKRHLESEQERWRNQDSHSFIHSYLAKHGLAKTDATVEFFGYSANIILKPVDYKRIAGRESAGKHFRRTPINLIKQSPDQESTIRHEENHNLSEFFLEADEQMYASQFIGLLTNLTDRFKKLKDQNAPSIILDNQRRLIGSAVSKYAQQNYHEVLADLDSFAKGEISTYAVNFFTAVDWLEKFVNQQEDEEVKELIGNHLEAMNANFLDYLAKLSSMFFVAGKMGKTAEAQALTVLYRPQEIGKAERHLRHNCPDYEVVRGLKSLFGQGSYFNNLEAAHLVTPAGLLRRLGMFGKLPDGLTSPASELLTQMVEAERPEGFFAPNNIAKLHAIFKSGQAAPQLSAEDRKDLATVVESFKDDLILRKRVWENFPQYQNVEQVLSLDNGLHDLADWLLLPQLNNFVTEILVPEAINGLYNISISLNDFSLLQKFIGGWPGNAQAVLKKFFEWYIGDGEIFEDYQKLHKLSYDETTIKQSNFWRMLESLNLADEAEKHL